MGRTASASSGSARIAGRTSSGFPSPEDGSEHRGEFGEFRNGSFENHVFEIYRFLFDAQSRIRGNSEFGLISGIVGRFDLYEVGKSEPRKRGRHGLFEIRKFLSGTYEFYEHAMEKRYYSAGVDSPAGAAASVAAGAASSSSRFGFGACAETMASPIGLRISSLG